MLENSQCQVFVGGASQATAGNTRTVVVPVAFKPGYAGPKNIYMHAMSGTGVYSTPVDKGDWLARSRVDSVTPNPVSTGQPITITGLAPRSGANGCCQPREAQPRNHARCSVT